MRQFPLMIFAAGFGTRMGALTADRPKPLVPVAGRALIDHALDVAAGAPVGRVVVNLHYRGEQLARHLAGRPVGLSWEQPAILETGGGLTAALPQLGPGPVMALNSDAIWTGPNPLTTLAAAWSDDMGALLLVSDVAQLHGRPPGPADFILAPDGRLTRAGGAREGVVYLGAQILQPGPVAAWPEQAFSLNRIWDQLIAEGRLYGVTHPGGWCDVGSPAGIAAAEALLAEVPHG
jgi:MurNAc alpha-1-phosphate uridylyltransferase